MLIHYETTRISVKGSTTCDSSNLVCNISNGVIVVAKALNIRQLRRRMLQSAMRLYGCFHTAPQLQRRDYLCNITPYELVLRWDTATATAPRR